MKIILVTYITQVPNSMTDQQIQDYLEYTLTERGELPESNPCQGYGPVPWDESIKFVVIDEQS